MQTASTETEMKMEEKKELEGCNKKTSCFRLQQQRKLRGKEKNKHIRFHHIQEKWIYNEQRKRIMQ